MARDYTITAARNAGEKDNPHGGTLVKWYLKLADSEAGDDDVYTQKKPGNDLAPGMSIYGRLEKGEFGWRFFSEQKDGSGSQGSSGGTFNASRYQKEGMTKDDYWTAKNERDIESQARMGRAHAQEMSLRWAAIVTDGPMEVNLNVVKDWTDWFHKDVQRFPLDADLGGGNGTDAPLAPAADVSAETKHWGPARREGRGETMAEGAAVLARTMPGGDLALPEKFEEASPAQKGKLTQLFGKAGLSRDAMKAVVLFRCRSEKATKDGASKLIQDLMDGATHDTLIAEIHDAKRAGDPVATRALKLIPADVPLAEDPNEKAKEYEDESGVPF